MKLGIITHHDVHNHGAQLQMFALQKVLMSFGHQAKALTYKKSYDFLADYAENKYIFSIRSIPYYIQYLLKQGFSKTYFNYKKKQILVAFRKQNELVGEYYSKANDLDGAFVGSDEVFSIETGLTTVFWGLGVPVQKIFSYAGCFGPTTIEFIREHYAEEYIKAGIERLEKLSVRDGNSKYIVEQLSNKEVTVVCDPVILYGYKEEKKNFKKLLKEKYLVIYSYDQNMNNPEEVKKIRDYAKCEGLTIVSPGFYHSWCDKNINVTPIELIEYIWGAECVITDTFHGSVISIIMNKEFLTKIRTNSNKVDFLLQEYQLSNRVIDSFNTLHEKFEKKIDYKNVNEIMGKNRKQSLTFIKECLESL